MPETISCRACREGIPSDASKCASCGTRVYRLRHILLAVALGPFAAFLAVGLSLGLLSLIAPTLAFDVTTSLGAVLVATVYGAIILSTWAKYRAHGHAPIIPHGGALGGGKP